MHAYTLSQWYVPLWGPLPVMGWWGTQWKHHQSDQVNRYINLLKFSQVEFINCENIPKNFHHTQGTRHPSKVWANALSRCSHCLWCPVTSQTPPPVSPQVGRDHLHMPGVQHHDHPASVGHKLWHSGQRDRELVNSSLHPPHSGQLCLLWAVHGQSLDGPPHKPTRSSPGHSEGRLADMTLYMTLCRRMRRQLFHGIDQHVHIRISILELKVPCSRKFLRAKTLQILQRDCDLQKHSSFCFII